jgi:hypothetical protein
VARFITNQKQLLKDLLETYIPGSSQLDFLVRFFLVFSAMYPQASQNLQGEYYIEVILTKKISVECNPF